MKLLEGLPRQPFIGVASAAILGIAIGDRIPMAAIGCAIAAVLAPLALRRRSSLLTHAFVVVSFFTLHSFRQSDSPGLRLARELGEEPIAIAVRGVVVTEPKISARGTASFQFALQTITRDGQTRQTDATILARWLGDVRYGDELQLFGVIGPVEPPRNPGEFDMRDYLARRDVRHVLVVRYPENGKVLSRGGGRWIMRAAHASRNWMQAALACGLEDSPDLHGLISGMVLGVRDDTPDEIEERFQQTGTLHLFAVSGLNVAIVAHLLWIVATTMRIPRRWAIGLIIPALFFYAAVTGLNPSSVRAALMAAVVLGGYFVDRKVVIGNTVGAAAAMVLCYDTNQLYSTGFQLSFAVVIAIVWAADPFLNLMMRWCEPDPFLPRSLVSRAHRLWQRSWGGVARGLSVSLAAWLGSLFLILPYFHLVTPVSLLANVVVVPLAFFVLAIGLMSLLVTPVASWIAVVFNNANWSLASAILAAVELFARAPAGHFYVERPRWPSGVRAELTALDVGPGAALHVRSRRGDWLVDAGPERDFKRIVRAYLRSRGINGMEGLVLTHGDASHIGAAASVIRAFRPAELIDTPLPDRSRVHRSLIGQLGELRIARQLCTARNEFDLANGVRARVLFPPENHRASAADDQALVAQLVVRDRWRVLLMSDSGEATERALLAAGEDLQSDILIKGQHHSGRSGLPEFLDRVQPRAIVASSPRFPEHERVKEDWAAMVAARGITLFRQDQTGAVTLRFFAERWEARPYVSGETFRSTSR
jgi:ComEC/Rec2-related protein